jgi:FAD/FMN-containing dehydrogenase
MPTKVRYEDFHCVESEEELLKVMNDCLQQNKGIRVIGSGWSWNKIIEADAGSINVILRGKLSTRCEIDVKKSTAFVAGGTMISTFIKRLKDENIRLQWEPKGYCFAPDESQVFAGFIANNVHHSYTPTAYQYVDFFDVAVYQNGKAAIVRASRDDHRELFESIIGGVGFTGIIVNAGLRLTPAAYFNRTVNRLGAAGQGRKEWLQGVLKPDSWAYFFTNRNRYEVHYERLDAAAVSARDFKPGLAPKPPFYALKRLIVKVLGFLNLALKREQGLVNLFEYNVGLDAVSAKNLPYYVSHSWLSTRTAPSLNKKQIIDLDSILDCSLQVRKPDLDHFLNILFRYIPNMIVFMVSRLLPKSGGGLVPFNADSDCIAIDILGIKSARNVSGLESALKDCQKEGLQIQSHTGKSFLGDYPCIRQSLSPDIRRRIRAVKQQYDPRNVFDGGKVKFEQIYDLSV